MASGTIDRPFANNLEILDLNMGYVEGETMEQRIQRFLDNYAPLRKPFIGCVLAGSYNFVAGYIYSAGNPATQYGAFIFAAFNDFGLYRINNGVVTRVNT